MNDIPLKLDYIFSPATLAALEELVRGIVTEYLGGSGLPDSVRIIPPRLSEALRDAGAQLPRLADKAEQPVAQPTLMTKWGPERIRLMATQKALGENWSNILAEVNALPGLPIASENSLAVKYHELKRAGVLPEVVTAAPPAARPVNSNAEPVHASYQAVRNWAGQRGMLGHNDTLDVAKVNAKRRELNLGEFVITGRGAAR